MNFYCLRHMPCWKPRCSNCESSPQAFAVHTVCMNLPETHKVDYTRLWIYGTWTLPWRTSLSLHLRPRDKINLATFAQIGLPKFGRLPAEILQPIYSPTAGGTLWECFNAASLAKEALSANFFEGSTWCVGQITSWTRGRPILSTIDERQLPILRISIDSKGIQAVLRAASMNLPFSKLCVCCRRCRSAE